jgi:gas vesicle protein
MKTRFNYPDSNVSSRKQGSDSKVLLGVLAGVATGAILGVLFAPDRGDETRRKLAQGSQDLGDNLKTKFGDLKENVADKYQTAKQSAADLIEQGKSKASRVAEALKSDTKNIASRAENAINTGASNFGTTGLGAGISAATSTSPNNSETDSF